jgi:NifU-like protein involved in Fe-S cluster formation
MATELLKGKTPEEARDLKPDELSGDLGPLPPMKIHCGQLVEQALKSALDGKDAPQKKTTETLAGSLHPSPSQKIKVIPLEDGEGN